MSKPEVFRMTGVIDRYPDKNAGYGFIKPTGEFKGAPNIFFHHTAIRDDAVLKEGDEVTFTLEPSPIPDRADVAIDIDVL